MGVVYRARDTRLNRDVALKVLPPGLDSDPERLRRFQREAESVARLNHPNIVTIHSVETEGDLAFLTMELVDGKTLDDATPKGGMTPEAFLDVAIPLADALADAHEQGIIHRDLKPGNIMVTADGRVKILDFGLAKLHEGPSETETSLETAGLTKEGQVVGTMPYMSPEQVKGETIDPRTDIFSLGIVFYEMVTGRKPFGGKSSAELISSILRDMPSPVTNLKGDLPRQLERIIGGCLEKNPEDRCQSSKELRNQLRALQRELDAAELLKTHAESAAPPARKRSRKPFWIAGAALAVIAVIVGLSLSGDRRQDQGSREASPGQAATGADSRPSLAVLHFQNLRSDEELEWLRSGLAEMLSTDLSQAAGLRVAGPTSVFSALKRLDLLGRDDLETTDLADLAEALDVDHLLLGSFARAGETYRVSVHVESVDSKTSLVTDRATGEGEESVFGIVDDLSRNVLAAFDTTSAASAVSDRSIADVTTTSAEAYRLYVEGLGLFRRNRRQEALPLFEQAVELDPGFAMALARLSSLHLNLGHRAEAREYSRRAFEAADRSPARERHYIRGNYLALDWDTYPEAIEEYERAIALDPFYGSPRNTVAYLYAALDRHQDAIDQYLTLIDRGSRNGGNFFILAGLHDTLGDREKAAAVLDDFLAQSEGSWYAYLSRGWHRTRWGGVDEALADFDDAEAARPDEPNIDLGRLGALFNDGRWEEAEALARRITASDDEYWQWRGVQSEAQALLFQGRIDEALERFDRAFLAYATPGAYSAISAARAADIALLQGDPKAALSLAEKARRTAPGQWPALEASLTAAVALERLGRAPEANEIRDDLRQRAESRRNRVEQRLHLLLEGMIALERNDNEAALKALTEAADLLPPRGVTLHRHRLPDHVPVWFSLASAHAVAGDKAAATALYQRIADSVGDDREFALRWRMSRDRVAGDS